jgi:hypothetical protein
MRECAKSANGLFHFFLKTLEASIFPTYKEKAFFWQWLSEKGWIFTDCFFTAAGT